MTLKPRKLPEEVFEVRHELVLNPLSRELTREIGRMAQ